MVNTTTLALLATAVISATAADINFKRFSTTGCEEAYHIRKDTNLHEPHCKTFSDHEPPFSSFIISPDEDSEEMNEEMHGKRCFATAYEQKDCKGKAAVFQGMRNYMDKCAILPGFTGRSVKISCEDKPESSSSLVTAGFATSYLVSSSSTPSTQIMNPTGFNQPEETHKLILIPADDEHNHDDGHYGWCPIHDGNGGMKKVKRGEACQ